MHTMGSRAANSPISLLLLVLLSVAAAPAISSPGGISAANGSRENICAYTFYVQTGSNLNGGTDSAIGVDLRTTDGDGFQIADLPSWGRLKGDKSNNFERGNLDIFSGTGPCMASPPCWMNLTSDGSGLNPGWFCNSVELTTTGQNIPCQKQLFTVEEWLDSFPHKLFVVRDYCQALPPPTAVSELLRRGAEYVM